jgi:hypothetical protein
MVESANIRSIQAIESFRSRMIIYLRRAENTVEEISDEVSRVRQWLQHDGLVYWRRQADLRKRKLEDAQQLLAAARLSAWRESTSSERIAVEKAQRDYDEAAEKLAALRSWNRHFEQRAAPLIKEIGKFSTTLSTEMPKATAYLKSVVKNLSEYAETGMHPSETRTAPVEDADLLNPDPEDNS